MNTDRPSKPPPLWVAYPPEVADVSLGEKLKQLRKEKGWSQDELAFHAQIDGRQVSRYENGRVMPSVDVIVKIAKAYDVSIDYLLLDDVPRRPARPPSGKLAERVLSLAPLSEDDEKSLLNWLDAIEARQKLKELAASVR
jgi:transcriptional regulator with XRE-family HTH domain